MQERIMEILLKLLREIDASENDTVRLKELSEKLKGQGISKGELDEALSWLTDRLQAQTYGEDELSSCAGSVRILHPVERMVFTPEAYGYLLQLEHTRLIDKNQMEAVIDKAMSKGSREITLNDIKMITASVVFSSENTDWIMSTHLLSDDDTKLKIQ